MRVKINLPESFTFRTEIPVRITDINYGGHVGNDAILSLMHEVRMQFLQHFGFTELDAGGASIIMADVAIRYKAEGFYGQVFVAEASATEFSGSGFDLVYRFTDKASGKVIAEAKTGIVCFDYQERKVVPVPEQLKSKIRPK